MKQRQILTQPVIPGICCFLFELLRKPTLSIQDICLLKTENRGTQVTEVKDRKVQFFNSHCYVFYFTCIIIFLKHETSQLTVVMRRAQKSMKKHTGNTMTNLESFGRKMHRDRKGRWERNITQSEDEDRTEIIRTEMKQPSLHTHVCLQKLVSSKRWQRKANQLVESTVSCSPLPLSCQENPIDFDLEVRNLATRDIKILCHDKARGKAYYTFPGPTASPLPPGCKQVQLLT